MPHGSYSALRATRFDRLREFANLYRRHARDIPQQVSVLTHRLAEVEQSLEEVLGRPVRRLQMLEIGPGQRQPQQAYFAAAGNDVLGIDLDVIPHGFELGAYLRMLQDNGGVRTLKTIGRKVLGLDAAYQRELRKQLGGRKIAALPVRRMDAAALQFDDQSFDVVYSFSAFEHLPDPSTALSEISRVLRPGGAVYVSLHLYTSDSGIHDPRIFAGNRSEIPFWAHLRPEHRHRVESNASLNKLRLHEWRQLFEQHLPQARLVRMEHDRSWQVGELAKLRAAGELSEYSDQELLTVDFCALWQKPDRSSGIRPIAMPTSDAGEPSTLQARAGGQHG